METHRIAECDRTTGQIYNVSLHRVVDVIYNEETQEVSKLGIPLMPEFIYFVVKLEDYYNCQRDGNWSLDSFPPQWIIPEPPPVEEPPTEEG